MTLGEDAAEPRNPSAAVARTLVRATVAVVSAYVGANAVPARDVPVLLRSVHAALRGLAGAAPSPDAPGRVDTALRPSATVIRGPWPGSGVVASRAATP